MAFPNSLCGVVEVPGSTVEDVIRGIERALEEEHAPTDRQERRLEFRVSFMRSGRNVLAPITRGTVQVAPRSDGGVDVSYRVTFTRLVWFTTVIAGFLAPFVLFSPTLSLSQEVGLLLVTWLWLTGGNYVLTRLRWPAFLARAARTSPRESSRSSG